MAAATGAHLWTNKGLLMHADQEDDELAIEGCGKALGTDHVGGL